MPGKVINRKSFKVVGLTAILLLALSLYFLFLHDLKIVVYNKTGYDIDSLKMGNKFFSIKKGGSLVIDNCQSIPMQADLPFGFPQANIQGKFKDTSHMFFLCGTGVKKIRNGKYQFDLIAYEDNNFYKLIWQRHK